MNNEMFDYISIIIPVYNDVDGLTSTINSLLHQEISPDKFEIIIADNGSNDGTKKVISRLQSTLPESIKIVHEDDIQGSYAARNKGIQIARADLYCFLDADVVVDSDFLLNVFEYFNKNTVDYLGCNVKMSLERKTLTAKYNYINGFNIKQSIEKDKYTPTCCLIVKKNVLERVGAFDLRLESGGDFEFGERVYHAGFNIAYTHDVVVHHPTRWKYTSLVSKSKRIGRGNAEIAWYYPDKYSQLYLRHFKIRNFLPRNPISYYRRMRKENLSISWFEACVLAVYHLPIAFARVISAFKRARHLRKIGSNLAK